jgi:hypothetical protein
MPFPDHVRVSRIPDLFQPIRSPSQAIRRPASHQPQLSRIENRSAGRCRRSRRAQSHIGQNKPSIRAYRSNFYVCGLMLPCGASHLVKQDNLRGKKRSELLVATRWSHFRRPPNVEYMQRALTCCLCQIKSKLHVRRTLCISGASHTQVNRT